MKKIYQISYGIVMLLLIIGFVIWKDMSDNLMITLAAFGFILTSIFTYSNRK